MPNIGTGALYISLAGILLYIAVAFGWRRLNYIWSAVVVILPPFLYNLLLASIQASALGTPIYMPKAVLVITALQLLVAAGVFYFVRQKQSNNKVMTTILIVIGFILLFMIIPWLIGLMTSLI